MEICQQWPNEGALVDTAVRQSGCASNMIKSFILDQSSLAALAEAWQSASNGGIPLLSRFAPVRGLVTLRQTFVRRCHLGWTASEPPVDFIRDAIKRELAGRQKKPRGGHK
jgi:hypothetical protein